jgi:hypothetical protein
VAASIVHENLAHEAGSDSEEMGAILPLRLIVIGEPEENLVDQRRRLQGMIASLAIEAERRDAAKLGVNQWYELSLGLPIPLSKPHQQLSNLALLRALPVVHLHLVPPARR